MPLPRRIVPRRGALPRQLTRGRVVGPLILALLVLATAPFGGCAPHPLRRPTRCSWEQLHPQTTRPRGPSADHRDARDQHHGRPAEHLRDREILRWTAGSGRPLARRTSDPGRCGRGRGRPPGLLCQSRPDPARRRRLPPAAHLEGHEHRPRPDGIPLPGQGPVLARTAVLGPRQRGRSRVRADSVRS